MNRRDILKMFGAGASVVPLIGGAPSPDVRAKLIEEPKVDIQIAKEIPSNAGHDSMEPGPFKKKITVYIEDEHGWACFAADTFIMKREFKTREISSGMFGGTRYTMDYAVDAVDDWLLEGRLVNGGRKFEFRNIE